MKKTGLVTVLGIFFVFASSTIVAWAVPSTINFQGRLTDKEGTPLSGDYNMRFRLFIVENGGDPLWTEDQTVTVTDGVYSVELGSVAPFDTSIFENDSLYLEVWILNEEVSPPTYEVLAPRQKITSTAFAIKAGDSETFAGYDINHFDSTYVNVDEENSITSIMIEDGSITSSDIQDNSITRDDIASGTISSQEIEDHSIQGLDIKVPLVLTGEIESDSILSASNTDEEGVGISGAGATGVFGCTTFEGGYGVAGVALGTGGDENTYGVGGYFGAVSTYGRGVYGKAEGEHGKGVYGEASGTVGRGVAGYASGSEGYGIYGEATATGGDEDNFNVGGYFEARSDYGRGVYGEAQGSNGVAVYGYASKSGYAKNYGGFFETDSTIGIAVKGIANKQGGGDNINYSIGGYFVASTDYGKGVFGVATGSSGMGVLGSAVGASGIAVYGTAVGASGIGVKGIADNSYNVRNYGGSFEAKGQQGVGVYGLASHAGGDEGHYNVGGYFEAKSSYGRGVYGCASENGDVTNYGGYFTASGKHGNGVYGQATGASGKGVHGLAFGTSGTGVYGYASGTSGKGVKGLASNKDDDAHNYGGYFTAYGKYGFGVYGQATGTSGKGVRGWASDSGDVTNYGGYFTASGKYGFGVFGAAKKYDFYAGGTGTNYGPFTGAHEVKLADTVPESVKSGMIMSVTGEAHVRRDGKGKISISSTLPTVTLATKPNDKAVLGAFVSESPLPPDHWYKPAEGERFGVVNALGEGRVWVSNLNGDIEAGDYITTSPIPGYGQKQDDDILHSYTLGKAIETVDWESVTETVEYEGKEVKVYLIAVVYTSG